MEAERTLQAVIFDLDGVITDTAEYHYQAWKDLAHSLGIAFDRKFNEGLKGISRMESLDLILAQGAIKLSDEDRLELAAKKNQHYLELIAHISPKDLLPGIKDFLNSIDRAGIRMALASASKNAPQIIDNLGVKSYFEVIVNPALARGKPAPDIFLKAAELLNVEPESCIGIEDAKAGVEAIKAAGMWAIGIGDAKILGQADLVLGSTTQLNWQEIVELWEEQQKAQGW